MIFNRFKRNINLEKTIAEILKEHSFVISVAESCTGGLLSSRLTDISGSSDYIKANFVTYSNDAKKALLDVKDETLKIYGAVSEQCAREMSALQTDTNPLCKSSNLILNLTEYA